MITFVEKYRAYLGSAPFKLRVDSRALAWLKTYSMDQSYIGSWIVRLDGYHMIIEHRTRDKHQNADSLSKKTEFYERLEERQANQAEGRRKPVKSGFCMTASAEETCDHLINLWIARHGCPITFQSDNGKAFVGDLTKELMKRSQVKQAHSTTNLPQMNAWLMGRIAR